MFFMGGVAKYLFVPLAEAVIFAMLASYLLSRTVVPTMAKYLLHEHDPAGEKQKQQSRNPLVRAQLAFEHRFEQLRIFYFRLLQLAIGHSTVFLILFFVFHHRLLRFALPVAGAGLLSLGRRRPVQASRARSDRHAH